MPTLAVRTHHDDVLGVVAPIVLAHAHPTSLVVDLDPAGLPLPGRRTLAELVLEGPTLDDLVPSRTGLALLANGGIDADDAAHIVQALGQAWPAVVLKLGGDASRAGVHLMPGIARGPAPHEPTLWVGGPRDPERTVLPAPSRAAVHAAFAGRCLSGRWMARWHRATERLWR